MSPNGEQVLLRFYLRAADRAPWEPTYQRIVKAARHQHMAGATVLKGIMGYGGHGELVASPWTLSEHRPVIVEIVDSGPRIVDFLKTAPEKQISHGMATLERAAVMMYRHRSSSPAPPLQLPRPVQALSTLPQLQPRPHMTITDQGFCCACSSANQTGIRANRFTKQSCNSCANLDWPAQRFCAESKGLAPTPWSIELLCWKCPPTCRSSSRLSIRNPTFNDCCPVSKAWSAME